ncbi:hypothetical protein CCR85_12400 [Rhodothalassium salexigens]|uniref:cation diffusion facilitator family transporter n=1 Tax=Rhodothalassium salexigens TaxID=1086 RepID=UPI0019115202|nr:cation diffusion facilitator family transporter [Rhodothalassium salexigens]MBK5912291.1 hypothetical protein [Rhodothalassium salexigens]MBK5920288.1 hypothetical protein [Rhodothalassium salexigens]
MRQDLETYTELRKWAARASMGVAFTLIAAKAVAWVMSESVAMFGSLADSTLDLAASAMTFLAVKTAIMPPDHNHRFGHGKAEALAALLQAAIMAGSVTFIVFESLRRIGDPVALDHTGLARNVSILAIVLTALLVSFQHWAVKRTGSVAIAADQMHYRGDLALNLSVIAAMEVYRLGGPAWADGAFGLLVAGYLGWHAWQVAVPAVDVLMDKEFSKAERDEIFNLVMGNGEVQGLHDLKTRNAGMQQFIQMHVEIDGRVSLAHAHMIATEIEATVGERFPRAEILIHMDPAGLELPHLTHRELDLERMPPS